MRTRIALFIVLAIGIIGGAQLSSMLLTVSPLSASRAELWLFFITLYVCISILLGLILYGLRYMRQRRTTKPLLWPSFRQAGLISLVVVLSTFFHTLGIFQLWNIIPLIIAAFLIEFFFQAEKKPHATISYDRETPN